MIPKLTSLALLLCIYLSLTGQSYEKLSEALLLKSNLNKETFDESIAEMDSVRWKPNDTIREYKNWLINNKTSILSDKSLFFSVHYFLNLAETYQALEIYDTTYRYIDSAANSINYLEYPESYYKVLKFGSNVAKSHTDYTTAVHFMKMIIGSKVLEQEPKRKGDILLSLSSILVNTHHYAEANSFCRQAYDIYQGAGNDEKLIEVLRIMYEAAHLTSDDNTCMDYLYEARDIADRSGDSLLRADVYSAFGLANYRNGNQTEAVRYYKMARELISEKGSYRELWAATYQHLSYTHMDSVESACKLSKYMLEQCLKNNSSILSNAYRGRAWCFAKNGQNDSAAYYLNLAVKKRESGEKADASPGFYYYLYDVAMLMKDYKLANEYLNTSLIQFRKYYRESVAEELTTQRAQFDYDLQKERIKKLRITNQLEIEKGRRHKVIIVLVGVLLTVTLVFLYLLRKKLIDLNITYKNIVRKNIELDKINTSLKNGEKNGMAKRKNNHILIKDEESIFDKLNELLAKEKIFRQVELTESKLAEILGTNTSYLSAIINKRSGMSFTSLLNHYRIEEARKLLTTEEYANFSIEGIASEVGYQSRSAFYRMFKQETGMTPSAYIKAYEEVKNNLYPV